MSRLEPVPAADTLDAAIHQRLARWNRERLQPVAPTSGWREELAEEHAMRLAEGVLIEGARAMVADRAAAAPTDPDGFVTWFEALELNGPGQHDPLFPWLAERADMAAMRWFLQQEAAGEAGFDDLVAMAQVKMPEQAKLELARNYWDEMGRGAAKGMHGRMLEALVAALDLKPRIATTPWPSLALANTMTALATTRRYAWQALGALGVIELTAPGRAARVSQGLRRLGVPGDHRHYFDLHAVLDLRHSDAWNREILRSLVADDQSRARFLAEGALIRLECGARCFEAYREHLWNQGRASSIPQLKQEERRWPIAS